MRCNKKRLILKRTITRCHKIVKINFGGILPIECYNSNIKYQILDLECYKNSKKIYFRGTIGTRYHNINI